MTTALQPLLTEVAGLPGVPDRLSQSAPTFSLLSGNGVSIGMPGLLVLPDQLPGQQGTSAAQFVAMVRGDTAVSIVANLVSGQAPDQAQEAVAAALLHGATAPMQWRPLSAQGLAAATRFAALPATAQHAWLATNLAALRAGQITVAQLP